MQIYINNKLAALKKGTSFDYVCENRLFSGSDGYSLTITFPLKDCPQNQAIFGHINRADVSAGKFVFDCEIRDINFYKFGCITIVEITESEVKTQFLDGRSEQNFDKSFDNIYINELPLGSPPTTSKSEIAPLHAWSLASLAIETCIPWVNNASGNIQNCAVLSQGSYSWHDDTTGLSWQIYLLEATRRICDAIGYSCDLSAWEAREEYKYLLICNTLPYSWFVPDYASALPHWSVEEFFQKLELFLGCEFDFDHRGKTILFSFSRDVLNSKSIVVLDNIVDEHSSEIDVIDSSCDYSETRNLVYKDCDHRMWKFYSCKWFVDSWKSNCVSYDTLAELLAANRSLCTWDGNFHRGSIYGKMLYAADVDTYFLLRTISRTDTGNRRFDGNIIVWEYKCILQPLNLLGGRIVDDSDDAPQDEIEFVPAWIDYTDDTNGWCLFLSFSGYDEESSYSYTHYQDMSAWYAAQNEHFDQTMPVQSLEAGESKKKSEYYDRIYIGWFNGSLNPWNPFPYPAVENITIAPDFSNYLLSNFSLRLNDQSSQRSILLHNINPSSSSTFKFIASKIPDVRSVFLIRGKKYVCEKLTATFTENGMSHLIKGVFFPLADS